MDDEEEYDEDELDNVFVQFPVDGLGSDDEFELRIRMQEVLEAELKSLDAGSCGGGDMGSGGATVFLTVRDPASNVPRLLEALRLYPPAPILVREPVEDDVILGEPVRRGVQVYVAPWVLHRHRKHWEHPTAFMPDRFAGQSSPWTSGGAYMPFGAGPRVCIGAQLALTEASLVLATIIQRFHVALATTRPVLPAAVIVTQPDHAAMFQLRPRN